MAIECFLDRFGGAAAGLVDLAELFSDTQNLCSATISDASIGGISFL
jgi:hypothetical protein